MAPEYLIRGQLTDKADVYGYGVLVLEIVSGRRNNAFREDSGSLLQTVRLVFNFHMFKYIFCLYIFFLLFSFMKFFSWF